MNMADVGDRREDERVLQEYGFVRVTGETEQELLDRLRQAMEREDVEIAADPHMVGDWGAHALGWGTTTALLPDPS